MATFASEIRDEVAMKAPTIEQSTRNERLQYVQQEWRCLNNCELCGKCRILRGRNAETVYADYIEGKQSYRDVTLKLRDKNN